MTQMPKGLFVSCFAVLCLIGLEEASFSGQPRPQSVPPQPANGGTQATPNLPGGGAPAGGAGPTATGAVNESPIKDPSKMLPAPHTAFVDRKDAFKAGAKSEMPGRGVSKLRAKVKGKNFEEAENRNDLRAHHKAYTKALDKFDKTQNDPKITDSLTKTNKLNKHLFHAERAHQQINKGLAKKIGPETPETQALRAVSKDQSELEKRRKVVAHDDFHELGENSTAQYKAATRANRDVSLNNSNGKGRVTVQTTKGVAAVAGGLGVAAATGGIGAPAAVAAGVTAVNTGVDVGRTIARTKDVNRTLEAHDPGSDEGAKRLAEKNAKHDKIAQAHGAVKAVTGVAGAAGEAAFNGIDSLSLIDAAGAIKDTHEAGKAALKLTKQ